jgi:RNA polymerase sigma-70 factor, ECF subfamily
MPLPSTLRRPFFEQQVVGVVDQLFGAALRLEKNREDAEDLVMETIAKAWSRRRSLKQRHHSKPGSFAFSPTHFSAIVGSGRRGP